METMASPNKLLQILMLSWVTAVAVRASSQVIWPDCPDMCGNVSIPYPFGTREDCSFNHQFLLFCNHSFKPPKPFFADSNIHVIDISLLEGELRIHTSVSISCYNEKGEWVGGYDTSLSGLTFPFSNTRNKLTSVGCHSQAELNYSNIMTGCESRCDGMEIVTNGSCSGLGCCQTSIPQNLYGYRLKAWTLDILNNHSEIGDIIPCSYAFIVEEKSFNFTSADLKDFQNRTEVPSVLDWAVGNQTCKEARKNSTSFACKVHSDCYDSNNGQGYRCNCSAGFRGNPYLPDGCKVPVGYQTCEEARKNTTSFACKAHSDCYDSDNSPGYSCNCSAGFRGNPYLPDGCKDIDECENTSLNDCEKQEYCHNILGNYTCSCPKGYHGDGRKEGERCTANLADNSIVIKVAAGIIISLFILLFLSSWLYWGSRQRKLIKLKEKFFEQNGGLMLKEKISKYEGSMETVKIFTEEDLKKATHNFNENRVLGKGGQGTVYKGILSDNREVAIKKSILASQSQVQQFINEVIVLSQINHRNVVKLLGCCLETRVPLLVYEFVTNGTLFDYIHNSDHLHASSIPIPWETRLRMAIETAEALSYLHSEASTPIIHRDVKTANILLDDNYTVKVSDFGASRLVPIDKAQLTTLVHGTLGYLDPEYFLTSKLSEKSDVYSFGVVLVELLTGMKAISYKRPEAERNLAMYFISSMKEDHLPEILDKQLSNEGALEQIKKVSMLAKRCLSVRGEERPTMKEVAIYLVGLRGTKVHDEIISYQIDFLNSELPRNHGCGTSSNRTGYNCINKQVAVTFDDGRAR